MPSQTEVGKAFEFALLKTAASILSEHGPVLEVKDSSYAVAEGCFNLFSEAHQAKYINASKAAIDHLIELEPRLTYVHGPTDILSLKLAQDSEGVKGDVRDLLLSRRCQDWTIGISAKNNHKAVKHSRLSDKLDFGQEWLGIPCYPSYFAAIQPMFTELRSLKAEEALWRNLNNKHQRFYIPLLNAFATELLRLDDKNPGIVPATLLKYLIGNQDFYKIIKRSRGIEVFGFHLHGTLNKTSPNSKQNIKVSKLRLPTRIIDLSFKPNSTDTLFLTCDEGWQISFRIHNASSRVEPSLKFDINLIGQPQSLYSNHIRTEATSIVL